MASLNKVTLIGNLGADPEARYTPGGNCVANFNIATNERWMNKQNNQWEERTEWHRVVVWGKTAEHCKEYLSKGRTIYVEGRLQTRKWEDKSGQTRYTTEIVAQKVLFLGTGAGKNAEAVHDGDGSEPIGASSVGTSNEPPPFNAEEDIPF